MKVLFEIYREENGGAYRAVYFTELAEHERDAAIEQAMNGEHVFDGFVSDGDQAKPAIDALVARLNGGERFDAETIAAILEGVLVTAPWRS